MRKKLFYPRLLALFIILILLIAYLYIGQLYVAFGPSMEPTIHNGERILVDKRAYTAVKPSQGDVVALIGPLKGRLYVKRVVAEEGDVVEIKNSGIKVNSKLLKNTEGPWSYKKFTITKGEVFVLGDNRLISYDSRSFGPVKLDNLLGEVKAVVWPPSSFRMIKSD